MAISTSSLGSRGASKATGQVNNARTQGIPTCSALWSASLPTGAFGIRGHRSSGSGLAAYAFIPRMIGSTSEMDPLITTSARSSISVGSALTMTTAAPAWRAMGTMAATG